MPFMTLWYLATQSQMQLWQRAIVTVLSAIVLGLLLLYLLRLVNENEAAHAAELKRPQKFSVQCGANIGDSYSENRWAQGVVVKFLHPVVRLDSGSSANCKAYLTRITKNEELWEGLEQLTWSPSEDHGTVQTLHHGIRYKLDVLAITSDGGIHVCNERRDWRRMPRLHDIFAEPGDYFLDVSIAGEGVDGQTFTLRFGWTRNWQTSFLFSDSVMPSA